MKKRSLSALALGLFVFLAIIPVAFSIVYFSYSVSQQMKASARESAEFYLSQATERTELTMDTLRNNIYYMMSNSQVRDLMQTRGAPSGIERRQVEDDLSRMLMYDSVWMQNCLNGVYIFKDDSRCLTMFRSNVYAGATQRISTVYERLKDKNSVRTLEIFEDYPSYVYCITDYIDLDTMEPLGKIIFEINPKKLMRSDYLLSLYPGAEILLLNDKQQVLYTSSPQSYDESLDQIISAGSKIVRLKDTQDRFFLTKDSCPEYDLSTYVLIPYEQILSPIREIICFYVLYILAALFVTLLAGLCGYRLLIRPIRHMVGTFNQMADGNLSVRMPDSSYQETANMVRAFNSMADRLESLFDEVYDKGMLLRDAEFRLLESQISPHFIFNVLESINMRCMVSGQPAISRMVTNLAQLLRSNILYKNQQKITYEQELRYVHYYLELQKERFLDQLEYEISYEDEDILHYYLPKLTIQPLVENSVVHGLENKRGGGTVRVWIWEEEDSIRVQVSDDGVGFDASELKQSDDSRDSHNNIALYNINRRIQLLYGKQYGLEIRSTPGCGTEATLTLPRDAS